MQKSQPSDLEWLDGLRNNDSAAVRKLYQTFRSEAVNWLIREYDCQEEDAADIFQEAIIALTQGAVQGKLDNLNCTLKTFLFSIAKNLARKQWRSKNRSGMMVSITEAENLVEERPIVNTEEAEAIKSALKDLGEPCYSILYQYYYQRHSLEVIAERMGYKSAEVVKTQKSRCLKGLRKQLLKGD